MIIAEAIELCMLAHAGQYRKSRMLTESIIDDIGLEELTKQDTFPYIASTGHKLFYKDNKLHVKEPYHTHPIAVADIMTTDEEKMVAYLHDVVEDTSAKLKMYGIIFDGKFYELSSEVVKALDAITKRSSETQEEYIARVAQDRLATKVKIADMLHNMSDNASEKQKVKYLTSLKILLKERA